MIPIATDTSVHRTPWVNYALIALNVLIFMAGHSAHRGQMSGPGWEQAGILDGESPRLYQFFTYMFLHASTMHVAGNMLFLWLFGNAVNAKMGHAAYLLFYLAGGVFAATGYLWFNDHSLLGASGAIAAITAAYLALFPRSRVTILYWWFLIGTFELPGMILIVFKMILWDNILAPEMMGASNVAFGAHLAGYGFGFAGACAMLAARLLPRDQFDIVALFRRWFQRQSMRSVMVDPEARARAMYGRVARPVSLDDMNVRVAEPAAQNDPVSNLRLQIGDALERGDRETASSLYEKLLELDPRQVLGRGAQLDVASELYRRHRFPQAAAAYEKFLSTYPSATEGPHIRLLLGIIYARDLQQYEVAEEHLRESLDRITDERRKEQAMHWLKVANDALGRPGSASA